MICRPCGDLGLGHIGAEFDVGAAAGHVGRDGDRATLPGVGDDLRLSLVVFRIEDFVLESPPLELAGERLRHLDRDGTDEHRQAVGVYPLHLVNDRVVLLPAGLVDPVFLVQAPDRPVGGNDGDVETVDREELLLLRFRRPGHARRACRTCGSSSGS